MAVDVEAAGEVELDAAGAVDELPSRLVAAVNAAEALGAELVPVDVEPDEVDVDEVDAAAAVELVDRSRL